jgi:hypothetical protein
MQHARSLRFLIAALVTSSAASAQVVATWDASTGRLPQDDLPAWTLWLTDWMGTCSGSTATLGGGLLRLDNSSACPSDLAGYTAEFNGPSGPMPATYFVEASARVVSSAQASVDLGVTGLGLAPPGYCPWLLELDLGEIRLSWVNLQTLGSAAVDTTTALRTYRLEVDTANHASRVYVDGVLVLSAPAPSFAGCVLPGVWSQWARFGNLAPSEGGVSEWAHVTHNLADSADSFCSSPQLNSSGWIASVTYSGDRTLASNDVVLRASGVPPGSFGYFLCSRAFQAASALPGSQGLLCLGPPVGRFNRQGEVLQANNNAGVELPIDLTDLPQPNGSVTALPGESWHFQLWYRDANPAPTSNLSLGLRLTIE